MIGRLGCELFRSSCKRVFNFDDCVISSLCSLVIHSSDALVKNLLQFGGPGAAASTADVPCGPVPV